MFYVFYLYILYTKGKLHFFSIEKKKKPSVTKHMLFWNRLLDSQKLLNGHISKGIGILIQTMLI